MNALHPDRVLERYGAPAFVAAAVHVVLLFGYPVDGVSSPSVEEAPETPNSRPVPAAIVEALRALELKPERMMNDEPVRPLASGPSRPETEDRSTPQVSPFVAPPGVPAPRVSHQTSLERIPAHWGSGGEGIGDRVGDEPNFFRVGDLDRMPRAKLQLAPDYPAALRAAGIEGSATIEFEVDTAGMVVRASVVSGTEREFEAAALRAVLKWRFEPGRRGGRAVPFRMVVPIAFSLSAD